MRSYTGKTTSLLTDLDRDPNLRMVAGLAITLLVASSIGLSITLRPAPAKPMTARVAEKPAIYIVQTRVVVMPATPAPTVPPTAEPAIVVAPPTAELPIADEPPVADEPQVEPEPDPEPPVSSVPMVLADPCAAWRPPLAWPVECGPPPDTTHERATAPNDVGPGGSGKMPAIDFQQQPPAGSTDAERWCAAAESAGKVSCTP